MENFKDLITRRLRLNAAAQTFLPAGVLPRLVNEELVKDVLLCTDLERHRYKDVIQYVIAGAQKTFAILVFVDSPASILSFVQDDQMQPNKIDQKLPFQIDKLLMVVGDATTAARFYNQQWIFTAPVFTPSALPRSLANETILPIITRSDVVGRGGFGDVYKIQIDSSHHCFEHPGEHIFIQKVLRPMSTAKANFELELRNLSTLRLLKHPCIIELLACFTYGGNHNFFFPLANGGSLADLLRGKRISPFETSGDLLVALCGLTSAMRAIHEFIADDLEAIGCHHDVKPSNILISGRKLVLADFGLSRFKDADEDSASYFRGGRGDYLAPECEDISGRYSKHIVHRSSDIWSMGCILAEILTFLMKGVEGVQTFRDRRSFDVEGVRYYRFHRGPSRPNISIQMWLGDLELEASTYVGPMRQLIQRMMNVAPEERPHIGIVDFSLRHIAVNFLSWYVGKALEELERESNSVLAMIEKERFVSWIQTVNSCIEPEQHLQKSFLSCKAHEEFDAVVLGLKELLQTLQDLAFQARNPQGKLFLPAQRAIDCLYDNLPINYRDRAQTAFEFQVLQDQDKFPFEMPSSNTGSSSLPIQRITQLVAIKRLKELVDSAAGEGERSNMLEYSLIERTSLLDDWYVGYLKQDTSSPTKQSIVVETKKYDDHYSILSIAQELFARLEAIVQFLQSATSLRVLTCRGYFHHPESYTLGLVYDYPCFFKSDSALEMSGQEVRTMHNILKGDIKGYYRPVLGDRFRLAYSLAASLLEFHKVDWVQKKISAFNILFFRPSTATSWKDHMLEPYFIGFLSSRQDDEASFTEGPTDDPQHQYYLHPTYRQDRRRYLQHYDYYSLGLVLLEMALWRTLGDISKNLRFGDNPEDFRVALLKTAVPRLGQTVGGIYQNVVEECLSWQPQGNGHKDQLCSAATSLHFQANVVERLATCKA